MATSELDRLREREAQLSAEVDDLRSRLARLQPVSASEHRYRLVVESAVEIAVITADLSGAIDGWNTGAEAIFGWPEQEMLGSDPARFFTPEDREAGKPADEMRLALATGRAEDERWHLRKDGTRFWATGLMLPLRGDDGTPMGFLKMLRDRTAHKRAQDKLQDDAALHAMLVSEISHRVKNSLALIAGLLTIQARASKDEDVRAALRDAGARVRTVANVHDRLWRHGETTTVDLKAYLADLCEQLRVQAPGHELHCDLDASEVPTDQAAPIGLLANELVINAFKHAYPAGHGPVRMSLRAIEDGPLRLEVADDGSGVPHGFDPRHVNGSLGMRLINGLTRQLKADLSVASRTEGATFRIDIPRAS